MSRRMAREELFKILFEIEMAGETPENILKKKEKEYSKADNEFIEKYAIEIVENKTELEEVINGNMKNWKLNRLGTVERTLLKIATYEILKTEVGTEIIINEAVELAKIYGDEKSYEFINGVLAVIVSKIRK
ncbi:MAG: transcription antitermination factor NusB [Fusobacteriia bacterium 4572_132]|nr:MAG: transcription antitermination factor NusB [Fusobacteriia bacterium 4572_132]